MSVSKTQFEEDLKIISRKSDKNEKLAWMRKRRKMEDLITSMLPLEEAILQLIAQKQPMMDEISELREIMVKECIHPEDNLVHFGSYVRCKFCNSKLTINRTLIDQPSVEGPTDTNG